MPTYTPTYLPYLHTHLLTYTHAFSSLDLRYRSFRTQKLLQKIYQIEICKNSFNFLFPCNGGTVAVWIAHNENVASSTSDPVLFFRFRVGLYAEICPSYKARWTEQKPKNMFSYLDGNSISKIKSWKWEKSETRRIIVLNFFAIGVGSKPNHVAL